MKKLFLVFLVLSTISLLSAQNADTTYLTLNDGAEIHAVHAGYTITVDASIALVDGKKMVSIDHTITGESDEQFYGVETFIYFDNKKAGYGFVNEDDGYYGGLFPLADTIKAVQLEVQFHDSRMRCMCPSNAPEKVFIISMEDLLLIDSSAATSLDSITVNMLDNRREKYADEWEEMQAAYKTENKWSAEVQIRYSYDADTDIMTIRVPGGTHAWISENADGSGDNLMLSPYYNKYKVNGRKWIELSENPFDYKGDSFNPKSATVELK